MATIGSPAAKPFKPGPAGTYHYTVTSQGGSVPPTSTLVVSPPQGTRQTTTMSASNGTSDVLTLDYRPDGVYFVNVETVTKQAPYPAFREDLKPVSGPVRVMRTGMQPGEHVTFEVASSDASATVMFSMYGLTTVSVAGKNVLALRVQFSSANLSGRSGAVPFKNAGFDAVLWLAPTNGVPYRVERDFTAIALEQTFSTHYTATLTSTKPQ